MGCIICRHCLGVVDPPECSIHHQRTGYGVSQKAEEHEVLPLCHVHHQHSMYGEIAFHAGQKSWEERYGKTELEWIALAQEEGEWND